jgi:nucleoside-diphosphate-sugar epimerase
MRLLVLGGTHFLGRHVVTAALAAGHEVATLTRGVSGAPPDGVRAFRADRENPLPDDVLAWAPEFVVDTSCRTRAAAEHATVLDPAGYAFVSSLNAYRGWPPGPVGGEHEPTWDTDDEEYGPIKAHAERVLHAAFGSRLLAARAGVGRRPARPVAPPGLVARAHRRGRAGRRPRCPGPADRVGRRP